MKLMRSIRALLAGKALRSCAFLGLVGFAASAVGAESYSFDSDWANVGDSSDVQKRTITRTSDGQKFEVVKYTASGTFTVPNGVTSFEFLVVGGGGAGGTYYAGGGAAGGLVTGCVAVVAGGQSYAIAVGTGGLAQAGMKSTIDTTKNVGACGNKGGDSSIRLGGAYVIAYGGGGGGAINIQTSYVDEEYVNEHKSRLYGGSIGGAGYTIKPGESVVPTKGATEGLVVEGFAAYGNKGGTTGTGYNCGGGGGAGGVGGDGYSAATHPDGSSAGGVGLMCDITGSEVYYAGGGAGAGGTGAAQGLGGLGGGGNVQSHGTDGLGGGGGAGGKNYTTKGGDGGSGVVIIRYALATEFEDAVVTVTGPTVVRYDGEVHVPAVTVTLGGVDITSKCDLSWGGNLIDAGLYTLTVRGKLGSEYEGRTADAHPIFQILPLRSTDYGSWGYTYWYLDGNDRYYVTAYTNAPLSLTQNEYHPLKPYCLWQAPTGVSSVEILAVGGAGGGSGGNGSQVGGGGNGGSVSHQTSVTVTPGEYYEVRLGVGGAGGAENGAGGAGGTTYLYAGEVSYTGATGEGGYKLEEWTQGSLLLSVAGGAGATAASGSAGANGANANTYDILVNSKAYGYGGAAGSGTAAGANGADILGQGGAGGGTNAEGGAGGGGTLIFRYKMSASTRTAWKHDVPSGDWNTAANWEGDTIPPYQVTAGGAEFYMLDGETLVTVNSEAKAQTMSVNNMAPLTLQINNKLTIGDRTSSSYDYENILIGCGVFPLPKTTLEFTGASSQLNIVPKHDSFGMQIGVGGSREPTAKMSFTIPASGWTTKETAPIYDGVGKSPITVGPACAFEIDATAMTSTGKSDKRCLCYAADGIRVTGGINYDYLTLRQWLASGRVQMKVPAGKRGVVVWLEENGTEKGADIALPAYGGIWFYLDEAIDIKDAVVTISKTTAGFTGNPVGEPALTSVKLMVEGVLTDITASCMLIGWKDENGNTVEGSQLTTWGKYTPIVQVRPDQNYYGGTVDNATLPTFEISAAYYHKGGGANVGWGNQEYWYLDPELTDPASVCPDNYDAMVYIEQRGTEINLVTSGSDTDVANKVASVTLKGNASDSSKYAVLTTKAIEVVLGKSRTIFTAAGGTSYLHFVRVRYHGSATDDTVAPPADAVAYIDILQGATLGIDSMSNKPWVGTSEETRGGERMVARMGPEATLKIYPGLSEYWAGNSTSSAIAAFTGEEASAAPRTLIVENVTAQFLSTSIASGVNGPLALQLTPGANNTTENTMLSFAGEFNVKSGSTLTVDASAITAVGTYPLVSAGSWTGDVTTSALAGAAATLTQPPLSSGVAARLVATATGINLVVMPNNEWHVKKEEWPSSPRWNHHYVYLWYKDDANTAHYEQHEHPDSYDAKVFVRPTSGGLSINGARSVSDESDDKKSWPFFKIESMTIAGPSSVDSPVTLVECNTMYSLDGDRTIWTIANWVSLRGCEFKFEPGSTGRGFFDVIGDAKFQLEGEVRQHVEDGQNNSFAHLRFPAETCGDAQVLFTDFASSELCTFQSLTGGSADTEQKLKFYPSGENNNGGFVQFLDSGAANGVTGPLHFDITLAANNLTQNLVASFAGSLSLQSDSTLKIDANDLNSPGVYTLIHAGSWTGPMTIDQLVASGNENLTGVASGLTGKIIKSADGKDVQLVLYVPTVTLDPTDGTGGATSVTVEYGADLPTLAAADLPTWDGHVFLGYFDAQTGGTKYYNADGTSAKAWDKTAATTLYAQWRKLKYKIVIPVQDGITSRVEKELEYDDTYCLKIQQPLANKVLNTWYICTDEALESKRAAGVDKNYSSWTENGNYYESTRNYTISAIAGHYVNSGIYATYAEEKDVWVIWIKNMTSVDGETVYLKADYVDRKWRVRYNANGGTGTMGEQSEKYGGGPVALLACGFTRTGYKFAGWSKTADGPVDYIDKQSVEDLTQDHLRYVDLYAVWTPITYTIVLCDSHGENLQDPITAKYDQWVTLPVEPFKPINYLLNHWVTDKGQLLVVTNGMWRMSEGSEEHDAGQWTGDGSMRYTYGTAVGRQTLQVKNLTATHGQEIKLLGSYRMVTVTPASASVVYDGTEKRPGVSSVVVAFDSAETLAAGDYDVSYADNTNAGTATVTVTGKTGKYDGLKATTTFTITARDIAKGTVENAYWTGNVIDPPLKVNGRVLVAGTDYDWTIGGASTNMLVGSYSNLVITGKDNYSGVLTNNKWQIQRPTYTWNLNGNGLWTSDNWDCNAGTDYPSSSKRWTYPQQYEHLAVIDEANVIVDLGGTTQADTTALVYSLDLKDSATITNGTICPRSLKFYGGADATKRHYVLRDVNIVNAYGATLYAVIGQGGGNATVDFVGSCNARVVDPGKQTTLRFVGTSENCQFRFLDGEFSIQRNIEAYRSTETGTEVVQHGLVFSNALVSVGFNCGTAKDYEPFDYTFLLGEKNLANGTPMLTVNSDGALYIAPTTKLTVDAGNKGVGCYPLISGHGGATSGDNAAARKNFVTGATISGVPSGLAAVAAWDGSRAVNLVIYDPEVTLDPQSGTGGDGSVTVTYGAAVPTITPPTREGYTFAGYYTEPGGGGTRYINADGTSAKVWDLMEKTTLYANWQANQYTLKLDDTIVDGVTGEGGQGSVTVTFDAVLPTLTSVPSKAGYTFLGYGIASFSGSTYSPILYYDANGTAVDGKKFDDSLLLVNEFRSVWEKNVAVPVGKTLTYNGALQTGVDASSEGDYTLSGHQQTAAGPYTATATLVQPTVTAALGLVERKWSDGGTTAAKDVSWSITAKALTLDHFEVSFDNGTSWQTMPVDIGYGANTPKYRAVYATGVTGEDDKKIDVTSQCSGSYKQRDKPTRDYGTQPWVARSYEVKATGTPLCDNPNYSVPALSGAAVGTVTLHANTYTWKGGEGHWGDQTKWTLKYPTPGCPTVPDDDLVAAVTDGPAVSTVNFAGLPGVVVTVDDKDYSFESYVDDTSSDVTFIGSNTVFCWNAGNHHMKVYGTLTVKGKGTVATQRTEPTLRTMNEAVKLGNGATLRMVNLSRNVSLSTIDAGTTTSGHVCNLVLDNCAFSVTARDGTEGGQLLYCDNNNVHFNVTMTNSTITSSSSSHVESLGNGAEIRLVNSTWTADYPKVDYNDLVIDLENSKLLLGRLNAKKYTMASTKISGADSQLVLFDAGTVGGKASFGGTFDVTYPAGGFTSSRAPISAYNGAWMDPLSTVNITATGCEPGRYPLIRAQTTDVSLPKTTVTPTITVGEGLVGRLEKTSDDKGVDLVIATVVTEPTVTVQDSYWTGESLHAPVTVTFGGETLVEGRDFTLTGADQTNVKDDSGYAITIKFIGLYSGADVTAYWRILRPTYIWKPGVPTGRWGEENWVTVPADYATTRPYPNGEQVMVYVTNTAEAVTVDLSNGDYKAWMLYIGSSAAANKCHELKNGTLTLRKDNGVQAIYVVTHDSSGKNASARLVRFRDMTINSSRTSQNSIWPMVATEAGYSLTEYVGDNNLLPNANGIDVAPGYLEYGWQTNLFTGGTTKLVAPLAYGPNAGDSHCFVVDNGFVEATHLVCKKSSARYTSGAFDSTTDDVVLNYVVRLGNSNTESSAAPLKATGKMRLTAVGTDKSQLFVDATTKGPGTYPLIEAAGGIEFGEGITLDGQLANVTVKPGYKASFVETPASGAPLTAVALKIEQGTISAVTLNEGTSVPYDGQPHQPTVKDVTTDAGVFGDGDEDIGWEVTYTRGGEPTTDFTSAGTITVTVTGTNRLEGSASVDFTITEVFYGWKGGASGSWAADNWTAMSDVAGTVIAGYDMSGKYPNSHVISPVFTNATPAATVDLGNGTYPINTMYFETANRVCLKDGTLTADGKNIQLDATGEVVFEGMKFLGASASATATNMIYGTVGGTKMTFKGDNEFGKASGANSTFTIGFGDADHQSLAFVDGTTTLATDVAFQKVKKIHYLGVTNACVSGTKLSPDYGYEDLIVTIKLGENNKTENTVLYFPEEIRLNPNSSLSVDARGKTEGLYNILQTAQYRNNIAPDTAYACVCDDGYVAEFENLPTSGNVSIQNYTLSLRLQKKLTKPTLASSTAVYNGSVQKPTVTNGDQTGITLDWGSADWTSVGEHKVTAKLGDNYCWENGTRDDVVLTFTITKAVAPTITVTGYSAMYDGAEHDAITAVSGQQTGSTLHYSTDGKASWSGAMPKVKDVADSKTVYVKATNANYEDAISDAVTVTVSKRSVTLTSATASKTYDGTPLTASGVTVTGDGFVSGEGATYNVTGTQTNAGTSDNAVAYTLNSGTKAGNYEIATVAGELTVNKKPLDAAMITLSKTSVTYTGSKQESTATVADGSPSILASTDYTGAWNDTEFTNAKTYTYTITAASTGNYTGSASKDYVISPAAITGLTLNDGDAAHTGSAIKRTVSSVTVDGQTFTSSSTGWSVAYSRASDFSETTTDFTSAGTIYVKVTGKTNLSGVAVASYTIYPNDYTWVGGADGNGRWDDPNCWDLEGYGIGVKWPGWRNASNSWSVVDTAHFTNGTYRVQTQFTGPCYFNVVKIKAIDIQEGADVTVWTESSDATSGIIVETAPVINGVFRVEGYTARGQPIALGNTDDIKKGWAKLVGPAAYVTGTKGWPWAGALIISGDGEQLVCVNDCKIEQGTWSAPFIAFCTDDSDDHALTIAMTNVHWATTTTSKDLNHVGLNADIYYCNSTNYIAIGADHFGGSLTFDNSVVAFSNQTTATWIDGTTLTEGDILHAKDLAFVGAKTKFFTTGEAKVTGAISFTMPADGFANDADTIPVDGIGNAKVVDAWKDVDIAFADKAPFAVGKSLDLSAATISVDASKLDAVAKEYPLAAVGASGTLTLPDASKVTITGCPKGFAAEVKAVGKTMVLSIYKPGLILIFE